MNRGNDTRRSPRIQSVDRSVALLRAIAAMPAGTATLRLIAERCDINEKTAWRLLATLEHHGVVERHGHAYRIGPATVHFARSAARRGTVRGARGPLYRVAHQARETASLAVPRELALVYAEQVAAGDILAADWLGRQVPLHATSTGKSFLAWLPEDEIDAVLPPRLERYTNTTIIAPRVLKDELARTRRRGYGTCIGELEPSLWGVSAPILDDAARPVAVVSVWGPSDRVPESRFPALGALVVRAADEIAGRLGFHERP